MEAKGQGQKTEYCLSPYRSSAGLKNINGDLTSFDMELLETRDAAQNRPFWRMLALYGATYQYWCMLMLDWIGKVKVTAGHRGGKDIDTGKLKFVF